MGDSTGEYECILCFNLFFNKSYMLHNDVCIHFSIVSVRAVCDTFAWLTAALEISSTVFLSKVYMTTLLIRESIYRVDSHYQESDLIRWRTRAEFIPFKLDLFLHLIVWWTSSCVWAIAPFFEMHQSFSH